LLKLIANERQSENPKAKLVSLLQAVQDYLKQEENLSEKDAIAGYLIAHDIDATLKGIRDKYAEQATNTAQSMPPNAGNAPKVASELIGKAKRASRNKPATKDIPALM